MNEEGGIYREIFKWLGLKSRASRSEKVTKCDFFSQVTEHLAPQHAPGACACHVWAPGAHIMRMGAFLQLLDASFRAHGSFWVRFGCWNAYFLCLFRCLLQCKMSWNLGT